VEFASHILLFFIAWIAAIAVAVVLMAIDVSILTKIIPVLLISFAIYFIFSPKLGITNEKRKILHWVFVSFACPVLGFFGPSTGTFMAMTFVVLLGFDLLSATAHAKLLNLASNSASLLYFIMFGDIYWHATDHQ